ncbi:ADP-ribosylglycohydrolase family protein, partial [Streptomyces thermoalcalitolerans]|uniref:ADP-ribosylglycohydrolase family protein n=1 Tax=Streptomyces thermoalcalitolerans TaxID=65605 RepID=UPI0031DB3058
VLAAALAVVPDDSWTARSLHRATAAASRGERAVRSAVVVAGYPWSDLAPEAVALAFGAYAAADGDFREAVLTAVNMGRDADTTAAVAGALAGATQGVSAIPGSWAAAIAPVRGRCLPSMAGRHVLEVADLLVARRLSEGGPAAGRREGTARTGAPEHPKALARAGERGRPQEAVRLDLDVLVRSEASAGSGAAARPGGPGGRGARPAARPLPVSPVSPAVSSASPVSPVPAAGRSEVPS